ncbi:MAG TPA: glucose-6-phosphate dehydrogenase [Anaeromyxobacteraceae bacterium]|nr:glucose-6-phosphate dehydrogenase [Anaeromyxobacteraceae bacterium]
MSGNAEKGPATLQRPGDPCAIVIFGVRGDLTRRKLLPALYNLRCNGLLPREFAILGAGRRETDDAGLREELGQAMRTFATRPVAEEVWADFRDRLHYVRGDIEDSATYRRIADRLAELEREHRTGGNVLFYLATPPGEFAAVARGLGTAGLMQEPNGTWRRVVVEKPFGRDLDSARSLNEVLLRAMREDQIFRIDHYLGKETVQNILVFRFANGIFEPIWNRRYIDHLQLTVAEDIGVEGRGAFYEQTGALRDVVQNHMFQLLALVAMEPPSSLAAEAVRNEKVKVLEAIRPMQPEEILQSTVRGQYGEGFAGGKKVPAYRAEPGVAQSSKVETYAALRLQVENWRWAGVPFYLRSGKRLAARDTQISIQFRRPPLLLFREAGVEHIDPNRLDLRIQPDESIAIQMKAKIPGPAIELRNVSLAFSYRDFGEQPAATGYERLLHDCMIGDASLFHRSDTVEAAWKVASPILDLWESLPARDFPNYSAGTWGPAAGDDLAARDGRRWVNPG